MQQHPKSGSRLWELYRSHIPEDVVTQHRAAFIFIGFNFQETGKQFISVYDTSRQVILGIIKKAGCPTGAASLFDQAPD